VFADLERIAGRFLWKGPGHVRFDAVDGSSTGT
jgi:hypothetical protein